MQLVIGKPEKEAEQVVHVWLEEQAGYAVRLVARGADFPGTFTLLTISKDGIRRAAGVAPVVGFALEEDGRLQLLA